MHASIRLAAGASISADEIIAFAKGQLGSVKTPKAIDFYDDLPKSAVGKLDKIELKRRATASAS